MQLITRKVCGGLIVPAGALAVLLTFCGCSTSNSSTDASVTATPSFSPAGGTFTSSQTVTISDTTSGAVLYCTTDGTTPTISSPQCSQPTAVFKTEYLQAIAAAPGKSPSSVASAGFTINLSAAATPTFSPAGGSYPNSQTILVASATAGANIYYTTDGSVPTASSTLYTGPITITKTETISAVAVASGLSNSAVASATYTINLIAATPTLSLASGTYTSVQSLTISDATPAAMIFYTTDGSVPSASSLLYTGSIQVGTTETINAIAVATGFVNSAVAGASYTIMLPAAAPTFSPSGGTYTTAQTVTITDATAGATIYYTTDGSTPSTASTVFAGPIVVSQSETLSAIAGGANFINSPVVKALYTINTVGSAAAPTFSPSGGTYTTAQTVTISDATAGATIYYTTDGSTPTTASTVFAGAIAVSQDETLSAIAGGANFTNSPVVTAVYTINTLSPAAAPMFSPPSGTYNALQTIAISSATPSATIFYTTDGSTPTASSTTYSAPVSVASTETINAIATAPGFTTSPLSSAAYVMSTGNAALQGTVMSGTTPVKAAQVQLYAAGQSGYSSAATALLPAAVATDDSGAFSFTYNCPASPGDLVYLVATGGQIESSINPSRVFMVALGSCSQVTSATKIVLNETTTIASAYALSAFIAGAANVGSSATNYVGLTNAFATVGNLVDIGAGSVRSVTPAYAANPVPYLNSSTVPQARIDTLANLLNACTGSDGGGCSNLFSAATPPLGTAPTDSLQAAINIAQNPGTNVSTLYALASPTGPFQPVLAITPGDWTLALTFTGAGLGVAPGTSAAPVINTALAIDATGNVWVTGSADAPTNGGLASTPVYAEFSGLGAPLSPNSTETSGASPTVTYGGYQPAISIGGVPNTLAFDPSQNLWIGAQGAALQGSTDESTLAEINSNTVIQSGLPTGNQILSTAIDGAGNVWLGEVSDPIDEYDNSGNRISPMGGYALPSSIGEINDTTLLFDAKGNLWGESNDGFGDLNLISQTDGSILFDPFFLPGGVYTPIAADSTGELYGCGSIDPVSGIGGQSLNVFDAASMSIVNTFPLATGRGCGGRMTIDGLGRIFAITGGTAPGIVDEFTTAGVSISPTTTGYTGTSTGEAVVINPDPAQSPQIMTQSAPVSGSGLAGAAIDGSGNLWVLNNDTGVAPSLGNVLVEYVGIGAPLVTPSSSGLQNKTLGMRP